jgi:hypothetical protein
MSVPVRPCAARQRQRARAQAHVHGGGGRYTVPQPLHRGPQPAQQGAPTGWRQCAWLCPASLQRAAARNGAGGWARVGGGGGRGGGVGGGGCAWAPPCPPCSAQPPRWRGPQSTTRACCCTASTGGPGAGCGGPASLAQPFTTKPDAQPWAAGLARVRRECRRAGGHNKRAEHTRKGWGEGGHDSLRRERARGRRGHGCAPASSTR